MLDKEKVKRFWDDRASIYQAVGFESVANLEQDKRRLALKIDQEGQKILGWLGNIENKTVLDLGAGTGQWAFRFSENRCKSVTAVEYSQSMVDIARGEAAKRGINNVSYTVASAEDYIASTPYDLIFISGLLLYLNDDQAMKLVQNLNAACKVDTMIFLRDATGVIGRHEINDVHSEHLQSNYSATYRTRQQYLDLFAAAGFSLVRDENMFEEGNPLNKYPETRLRIYQFKPDA